MSDLREALDYWRETDFQAKAASGGLELAGDQVLDMGRFYAAARHHLSLTETLDQLHDVIHNEGPKPRYHREIMERHRTEWPTLWTVIDQLLAPHLTEDPS